MPIKPNSSEPGSPELEAAIDAVVASYSEPLEINNLESVALPNKRAVLEAYSHIVPVLFMGFYSTHPIAGNLRETVGPSLVLAHDLLVEQVDRAVRYEERIGRRARTDEGFCGRVVLELIRRLPELRGRLNGDVVAAYEGDPAAKSIEEVVFSMPGVRAITAHRIAHLLYKANVPMIPRIIAEHAHGETGIDIHPGATIGDCFFVDHGSGVVIGETAVIGANVKLYQGVTLGALSVSRRKTGGVIPVGQRHPTIEDDVTIYAGATILGGATVIGRGSVVGANAWLMQSIPPNSRIMGSAAVGQVES
jgi:serine O-acetyltransferase